MKSSQMKAINARKRSRSSFHEGINVTKVIAADTVTHGGYSKGRAAFHFISSLRHWAESRRERKKAKKEARILRRDSRRRKK